MDEQREKQLRAEIEAKLAKEAAMRAEIEAKLAKELKEKQWNLLNDKANEGDSNAQFELAECYFNGKEVNQDFLLAIEWYTKAAESGHLESQKKLYDCYINGNGIDKDTTEAIKWLTMAADAGDALLQSDLANRYANGIDVEKDFAKAYHYYKLSAEQGCWMSIINLGGWCYLYGNGVEKNLEKAIYWIERGLREYGMNDSQNCYEWTKRAYSNALSDYGLEIENNNPDDEAKKKVFEYYQKSAELGNTFGISNLGHCYHKGIGVEVDLCEADELFLKAKDMGHSNQVFDSWIKELEELVCKRAEEGDENCEELLINWYSDGSHFEKDNDKLLYWLRKSAEEGHAKAQCNLGVNYLSGYCVAKDITEAVKWFRKSAEQGYADAQNRLGARYFNGEGVEKDFTKAAEWFRKSAEQGYAKAQTSLGFQCYFKGQGVTKDYVEAFRWIKAAAEQNYDDAQVKLAFCYYQGVGVEQDYNKAVEWYRKAAEQGYCYGQSTLGNMYFSGLGVTKDYKEAAKWFKEAANQGESTSQARLGIIYLQGGFGITLDYAEAAKWFRKSAEQGNADSQYLLGAMYYEELGFMQEYAEAAKWFRKSAEQGNEVAQLRLGEMHYFGQGNVIRDYAASKKWLRKSAKSGNTSAQKRLEEWFNSNINYTLTDYFDYSTIEEINDLAKNDPAYYPINAFDEGFDVFSIIEKCAAHRYTLPVIPTSYYHDELKEVQMHIPCGIEWQSTESKCRNVVMSYNGDEGKAKAIATINQMITSILLAFPIKKVHLNIIDLDNTLDFVLLSGNLDKQLVTRISDYKGLQDLTNRIDSLIDKASTTPGFSTMEEYNVKQKCIAFPYELVLIANYNGASFSRYEESLVSYFKNGGKFGTYFFLANNTSTEVAEKEDKCLLANKEYYLNVNVDNINIIVDENNSESTVSTLSFVHNPAWRDRSFNYINSAANMKVVHTMDWNSFIEAPYPDMDSDIDSPIGFLDDGSEFNFRMGISNSHYHAFMIGETGSGKSRFLHDIILSMTIKYKPEDLELYLMDFKGVEFNDYKDFGHVRTVLVNRADEGITYEVIKDLRTAMETRERLLRDAGASDVAEYNRNKSGKHISQILLIADECQTLFADRKANTNLQNEIVDTIALIAQQGRAYGVHLLLATQSLANTPQLGKEILNQISDYYILPCKPEDAARLVPDYARTETEKVVSKMEKGKGQCYYLGPGEHFAFTYNYVSKGDMQPNLTKSAINKANGHPSNGQIYFSGSLQYDLDFNVLDTMLNKKGRSILASPGQEIGLTQKPIMIPLKEDLSENILLLGINDEHFVSRTTMNVLASLILTNAKKGYGYRFLVFDCLADDEADYFYLLEDLSNNGLCQIVENRKRISVLKQLCDDISSNQAQPTILVILGQERFRNLKSDVEKQKETLPDKNDISGTLNIMRQVAINASESNTNKLEIKNARDAITYILEQGPESNVHTIMQLDKVNNFLFIDHVGKNEIYKRFKHLVLLRSEADTSLKLSLVDDIHLNRMEKNSDRLRAYYYNEESDKYQLLTPFTLPTIENINNLIK